MLILIIGGSGSGKSLFAEQLFQKLCPTDPRYYIATMQVWDEECRQRIRKHRQQRAGKGFQTLEIPDHLLEAVPQIPEGSSALLECIGNLVANEQFGVGDAPQAAERILSGLSALQERLTHLVVVTNMVSAVPPPDDPAMIAYLKHMETVNCTLAHAAQVVLEVCSGLPILWKGASLYHEIMD
jgi:adenosylcobinamide kinase/adenosylcobinamide-phosphate guanylyltransferase